MGLHDSLEEFYGPFTKPTHRMGEWAVCQDEKCGHVSDGIITGMEERAPGCMIQPDSYWDDSKTLMCSWRGQGKRWGDSVSSAMLLVVEQIKGGQHVKKIQVGIQRNKTLRMNATSWKKFYNFLLFFLYPDT